MLDLYFVIGIKQCCYSALDKCITEKVKDLLIILK